MYRCHPFSWDSRWAVSELIPNENFHCLASYRQVRDCGNTWKLIFNGSEPIYSDLSWRKTLLAILTVKIHDSEVYRLLHPKFLSASLVWEIQRNPEERATWVQRIWSWKATVKTLESYLTLMPISHDTKKAKTVYGEICAAVGLRHSPMVYQMVWVGESWGGAGTPVPQEASAVPNKCKQYCPVINFSFTDLIIWAAHQEADANFCSHPTAVRLKAFHEKRSPPSFSCWSEQWWSSLSPWPVLLLICLCPTLFSLLAML